MAQKKKWVDGGRRGSSGGLVKKDGLGGKAGGWR